MSEYPRKASVIAADALPTAPAKYGSDFYARVCIDIQVLFRVTLRPSESELSEVR